jgi:glutaredoxin
MHDVVVYSRAGCHLCETVKETLVQLQADADFQWHEVDMSRAEQNQASSAE